MNHEKKTTRIIYALAIGTLLIAASVIAGMSMKSAGVTRAKPVAQQPVDMAALHGEWLVAVRHWTSGLTEDSPAADFAAAKQALLKLRVTAADRDAHAALVMALLAIERGEPGAFDSLVAAREAAGL
jgi:hypothetical protein